jgi:hypothetical protein
MSHVSLDLDKIRISSAADKLKLFVDTTLSFQSPQSSFQNPKHSLLDLFLSREAWICRGSGCRLDFALSLNGQPITSDSQRSFMQRLATHLRDEPVGSVNLLELLTVLKRPKFWPQLCLDATIDLPYNKDLQKHDFSLHINYIRQSSTESLTTPIISSAPRDMKPPDDVPCFELRSVDIALKFKDYPGVFCEIPKNHRTVGLDDYMLLDENVEVMCDGEPDLLSEVCDYPQSFTEVEFDSLLGEDVILSKEELLLYNTNPSVTSLTALYTPESQTLKEGVADQELVPDVKPPNFNSICRIASFALRTLIGGRQNQGYNGMKLWKNNKFVSMAEIAPALWNPGFLQVRTWP